MIYEIPVRDRPGRRFQPSQERLLDDDLVSLAKTLPGASRDLYISREVVGPRGIADMVVTTSVEKTLESRLATKLPPLTNLSEVSILAAAYERRTLSAESIALRLGLSLEQTKRRISHLVSRGYLERVGGGVRKHQGLLPIGRTYGLEAKVNDWQKGLMQTLRYGTWCDATAVVLLHPPRDLTEIVRRFKHLKVGLAVQDQWILRPRLGQPQPAMRLLASELWLEHYAYRASATA